MNKSIIFNLFIVTILLTLSNFAMAESSKIANVFSFDSTFSTSEEFESKLSSPVFQSVEPVEGVTEHSETTNDDYSEDFADVQPGSVTGVNEEENSTSYIVKNDDKKNQSQDFPKEYKSLFMFGIDTFWGSLDFFTIGGIIEIGFPNIFDGFGVQFGFGFGVWDLGSNNNQVAFDLVLGIKYTLNAGKFFYPSVGLRIFGVTTFNIFGNNDENSGLELYFDIRIPFAEIVVIILHFGPQIPMDDESEGIFTAGFTLALHF